MVAVNIRRQSLLTQEKLKSILHYDAETGVFTSLRARGNVKKGQACTAIDSNGYICISLLKQVFRAHRLAWFYVTGEWPKANMVIDHVNRIKTDNRLVNLREATYSVNAKNRGKFFRSRLV